MEYTVFITNYYGIDSKCPLANDFSKGHVSDCLIITYN